MVEKMLSRRLGVAIVLVVACSMLMAVPAVAQTPPEANTNSIAIGMSVPAGTYYYGDTIWYTVTVYVPGPTPPTYPAQQTDIETHLVLPNGTDLNLGTIAVLNPGESYSFPAESYVVDPLDVVEIGGDDVVVAEAYCDGTAELFPPVSSHADVGINTNIAPSEVGGTVLPVPKLGLLAPWLILAGCFGGLAVLALLKKREA
jgi:hypothetical protein